MRSSSRRALAALHDAFWAVLVLCPVALVVVWLERLPEPPERVTYATAYEPLLEIWGMLLLLSVGAMLLVFLAEYATRRLHRWAAEPDA